jgi:DNA-binding FrmR family transcriptional regulator
MKKIIHRVHRVQGQLRGIEESINNQTTCDAIIPQLLAVKGSVDALVRAYLECSLDGCSKDTDSMRHIIKQLIQNV